MLELKNKILEVKTQMGITNAELSLRLGKSKTYIQDILRSRAALSTNRQLKLKLDLESLLNGGLVLDENDLLDELHKVSDELVIVKNSHDALLDEYARLQKNMLDEMSRCGELEAHADGAAEQIARQQKRIIKLNQKLETASWTNKIIAVCAVAALVIIFLLFGR